MTISELAYELYKSNWKKEHGITPEREDRERIRFFLDPDVNDGDYSYEEYIFDYGYGGQLYVCYDEFLGAEYRERMFMKHLINDDALYGQYLSDVENRDREA